MNKQERQQYRQARIRELYQTVNDCWDELATWKTEERLEQNADKVGRYYRYRDSYSSDELEWWQYVQVTSINEDGYLTGWAFEKDSKDNVSVRFHIPYKAHLSDGYEEIALEQFWAEWQKIKSELDILEEAK